MPSLITYVEFDEQEIDTLLGALQGHGHALVWAKRKRSEDADDLPVRRHIARLLTHKEHYDRASLQELELVLSCLIRMWEPQTTNGAWQAMGAPGSDDALAGLALERRHQIQRAHAALELVNAALDFIGARDAVDV